MTQTAPVPIAEATTLREQAWVFFNGDTVRYADAKVGLLTHGLNYGTGIFEGIAFFKPGLAEHLPRNRRVDVCVALERDEWQGQVRVRAKLRDIRPAQVMPVLELSGSRPTSSRPALFARG